MILRRSVLLGGLGVVISPLSVPAVSSSPTLSLNGSRKQGGLMIGKVSEPAEVMLDGKPVSVSPDGYFAFGLEYNQTTPARLAITGKRDRLTSRCDVAPLPRTYEVQRINGLPPQQAHPTNPAIVARIARENAMIATARTRGSDGIGFTEPFDWPVSGIVSGLFGSQRVLNGVPAAPHFGVDIAAAEGTPIHAPADGTVCLAQPDFYLTGGTTVVDHGHGVFTLYIHQNAVKATVGQTLKRGDVIGLVGQKGRATGPHLHWGLNWFQMKLDPSLSTRTPLPAKA